MQTEPRAVSKFLTLAGAVMCCAFLSAQSAEAISITGVIDMSGTVVLDSTYLGSATEATSFSGVTVGGIPSGSFAGTYGDSVTWAPFGWAPATTPVIPLWTFSDAGTGRTYSFDLSTVVVVKQTNKFLNLLGSGTLYISGAGPVYDPTPGVWSFAISNPTGGAHSNFAFTFASSQTAAQVPDSGATLGLLGLSLVGLEGLRRRFASS